MKGYQALFMGLQIVSSVRYLGVVRLPRRPFIRTWPSISNSIALRGSTAHSPLSVSSFCLGALIAAEIDARRPVLGTLE
jgi:hypothetical protein